MDRRARIVATLGPASADAETVAALVRAGADVFRLNLSHGSPATHRAAVRIVRAVEARLDRHVALIFDLMGPRYRLATLPEGTRLLRRGERLRLGEPGAGVDLPVDDHEFLDHLRIGERVLVDNGLVELTVTAKRGSRVQARVVHGGTVATRKGINLPDSRLPFSISAKDRADIAFAVALRADFLAASYIGRARDIEAVRDVARAAGAGIPVIAKLERAAAVEHIDEIVRAADAVMVARGDLGVEVPLDQVPVLQKKIVAAGRRAGKPVIVATQMLESMMSQPRPTRAESSDVANAVIDGADALMLSGETAAGRFPVEAARTMARIILAAERYRREASLDDAATAGIRIATPPAAPRRRREAATPSKHRLPTDGELEIADVVAAAAVHAAGKLAGSRIVAFSQGGFTAARLARYRPAAPTYVFTTHEQVARRIQLLWGMRPIHLEHDVQHRTDLLQIVERELLARGLARPGECVVLLMGYPVDERPLTNLLRIHRIHRIHRRRRIHRIRHRARGRAAPASRE